MARYVARISSPLPKDEAFAYMADLTNFAAWDPGVTEAVQVEGQEPAEGSAYDVTVKAVPRPLTLRYHITAYTPSDSVVARAESNSLVSLDTITVEDAPADGDDTGSIVTYDAELTLKGVLGLANPLLALVFNRIGDKAAAGMATALKGRQLESV
ncbi:MAG: SRPBCC family protein [Actinomycetota bacterium]